MSHRNQVIEYIARKSLICLILTFVVNLIMNLFKVTKFIGNRSDVSISFQVYCIHSLHSGRKKEVSFLFIRHLQYILRLLNLHS